MCLSCGCMLPAQTHKDTRNIIYRDIVRGKTTERDYVAANKTPQSPGSVEKVKSNIAKAIKLIDAGKLDKDKRE